MPHYPCPDCCDATCIIATDDYGDGSFPAWTEVVGNWTEAGGVMVPDPAGSNQQLSFDTSTLADPYAHVVRVRMRGDTGDRAGLMLYNDASNYAEVTVRFGSGTFGRINFNQVDAAALVFTWNAELECSVNEYNIPPNEWVTLTLRFSNSYCSEAIINVVVEVDDTSETHTLGIYTGLPLPATLKVGLITGTDSIDVEFDDFSLETGSTRPTGACEHIVHCCVTNEADQTGNGDDGWDIVTGSWTDDSVLDSTEVDSTNAKRLIEYTFLNDNLTADMGLGPVLTNLIDSEVESVWRYYFSVESSDDWWIEVRYNVEDNFLGRTRYCFVSLENEGLIKAWIYYQLPFLLGDTEDSGDFATLNVIVYDCTVVFGLDIAPGTAAVYYSETGGEEAEEYAGWLQRFDLCIDGNELNRTGQVGIGSGNPVQGIVRFTDLSVTCSLAVDCDDYPATEVPDPDDPDDPTGCCDGYDTLQTGDPLELTLSSWAYWFGAGCADMGCSVGSDFLTDFNATHTLTLIEKEDDYLRFIGNLPDNECDECAGIVIRESIPGIDDMSIRLHNRAELVIQSISETECKAMLWIRGRCAECVWYFENTFTKGADCSAITMTLISGNSNPGGYMCCLQAGSASFDLP